MGLVMSMDTEAPQLANEAFAISGSFTADGRRTVTFSFDRHTEAALLREFPCLDGLGFAHLEIVVRQKVRGQWNLDLFPLAEVGESGQSVGNHGRC
jgi:hypothetical protein